MLGEELDKLAGVHLSHLTMVNAREVIADLQAPPNEQVVQLEVAALSPPQCEVLMKVLYMALGTDHRNSTAYFKWHAALYAAAGPGVVLRTLMDKEPPVAPVA